MQETNTIVGNEDFVAKLVSENIGWATSIAKCVARAWNLDWQLDGLDGGAYEGLLFCARRYDPTLGVPFRGYARRRIHEACTEEARKSKSWQRGTGVNANYEAEARELSSKLFQMFPELREGVFPGSDEEGFDVSLRGSVRQLLIGASLLAAFEQSPQENPELAVQYKALIEILSRLEPVHQLIIWNVYYKGLSLRSVAEEWGTDDLSVIREHKELLEFLCGEIQAGKNKLKRTMKVRRALRIVQQNLKKSKDAGPFSSFTSGNASAVLCVFILLANLTLYYLPLTSEKIYS